jgi:hypothetical protein
MHGFFTVSDYLRWIAQLLLILLYGASVAAFTLGLKRVACRIPIYFSGLLFLALCPFLLLFVAAALRLAPILYHFDRLANAQDLAVYAIAPLYLGLGTTLLLVILYSALHIRSRNSIPRA